ncbi:GNAT family acetyltransferase [Marinimicrobium locisalis]|uniref:GNAT family acetyltransferase n=1 Tax=Marinimicrobium locisalis TaxID=546022 RepID=UPI0032216F94
MKIRLFKEQDREPVISLWRACGLTRPWNDPDSDISRKLAVQPELFFVGEIESKVVASAMAGYDGHRGSVFYLAVSSEYQNRGFGRLLMQTVEDALKSLGCPKLNIVVRSSNEAVLDFYRHLGYTPDDVVSVGKRLIPDG